MIQNYEKRGLVDQSLQQDALAFDALWSSQEKSLSTLDKLSLVQLYPMMTRCWTTQNVSQAKKAALERAKNIMEQAAHMLGQL